MSCHRPSLKTTLAPFRPEIVDHSSRGHYRSVEQVPSTPRATGRRELGFPQTKHPARRRSSPAPPAFCTMASRLSLRYMDDGQGYDEGLLQFRKFWSHSRDRGSQGALPCVGEAALAGDVERQVATPLCPCGMLSHILYYQTGLALPYVATTAKRKRKRSMHENPDRLSMRDYCIQ